MMRPNAEARCCSDPASRPLENPCERGWIRVGVDEQPIERIRVVKALYKGHCPLTISPLPDRLANENLQPVMSRVQLDRLHEAIQVCGAALQYLHEMAAGKQQKARDIQAPVPHLRAS